MGQIISIINQKGGVGKTSSSANIAMSLAELGKKVLMIDADAQCDLTTSLGVFEADYTLYDFLSGEPLTKASTIEVADNLFLMSGYHDIMEFKLTKSTFENPIKRIVNDYDFIIVDCQPQRVVQSRLILNECILNATDYILLPLDVNYNSVKGTLDFINSIHRIKSTYNHDLKILGIFFTKVNERETQFAEFRNYLQEQNDTLVFESFIRRDVNVKKSQSVGQPLALFNNKSNAYADYSGLVSELMQKVN